jgi:hypothetical protein
VAGEHRISTPACLQCLGLQQPGTVGTVSVFWALQACILLIPTLPSDRITLAGLRSPWYSWAAHRAVHTIMQVLCSKRFVLHALVGRAVINTCR